MTIGHEGLSKEYDRLLRLEGVERHPKIAGVLVTVHPDQVRIVGKHNRLVMSQRAHQLAHVACGGLRVREGFGVEQAKELLDLTASSLHPADVHVH